MGKLLNLDECIDAKKVGSLGSFLAQVARNGLDIVPGFVLPIDCDLKNGVSNELLRYFDKLDAKNVILRETYGHEHL